MAMNSESVGSPRSGKTLTLTLPARVTPAGDATQAAELHAQFAAITDPTAQTTFWRKLTPEQQALILKHQA